MKIERIDRSPKTMTISEFAKKAKVQLKIYKMEENDYIASLYDCTEPYLNVYFFNHGHGETEKEAIIKLCQNNKNFSYHKSFDNEYLCISELIPEIPESKFKTVINKIKKFLNK